jgi:hypothetical protein
LATATNIEPQIEKTTELEPDKRATFAISQDADDFLNKMKVRGYTKKKMINWLKASVECVFFNHVSFDVTNEAFMKIEICKAVKADMVKMGVDASDLIKYDQVIIKYREKLKLFRETGDIQP